MNNLSIDIQVATDSETVPTTQDINRWVSAALTLTQKETELSIRFVDNEESARLNKQFRRKIGPTNVLSFPFETTDNIPIPLIGDIVICAPTVEKEAKEQNKLASNHWAHMVIHGTLHLLGYDHIESHQATVMEGLEISIMASLGLENPYKHIVQTSLSSERGQTHPLQPTGCSEIN